MVEISGTTSDISDGVLKALSDHIPDAYYAYWLNRPASWFPWPAEASDDHFKNDRSLEMPYWLQILFEAES